MRATILAALMLCAVSATAQAHMLRHHHARCVIASVAKQSRAACESREAAAGLLRRYGVPKKSRRDFLGFPFAPRNDGAVFFRHRHSVGGSNTARARARGLPWCGAWLADHFDIGGELGRALWVARNWAVMFGRRALRPAPGVVVVWPHHVGIIRGGPDPHGRYLVQSGNDGHAVRTRYRSLRSVIAFRV